LARLIVYLVGVGAMGMIAQGTVGGALHNVVWSTHERPVKGETRVVTETAPGQTVTITGETAAHPDAPGKRPTAPATTAFVTTPGSTTTTTVSGPVVTTMVSDNTETVPVPGPTVTTTVPGPTVTTTVPGPTVTTTVPGPTVTTTVLGPTVTTTVPGPTETVTVTVEVACDPPPKPSNPPCPPHK
jgi:hypothetical protein